MTGGEFAHLAGADDKNVLALQCSKNLFCQLHCNRGDRHRRGSYRGLGTNAFGHSKGAGEKLIELSANRAHRAGSRVSLFHLTKNLRLSDHHRIQAGSDTKNVPHGIFLTTDSYKCVVSSSSAVR